MDIRNIKEPSPIVNNGEYLEKIFELQSELLTGYMGKIEKNLPPFPIDIQTSEGQIILKDFTSRIIEEIAEGYESTENALNLVKSYGYNMSNITNLIDMEMILSYLQNSNEEQVDALAFFIDLLLYANIDCKDIYTYCMKTNIFKVKYNNVCSLHHLMVIGYNTILSKGFNLPLLNNLFPLVNEDMCRDCGKDYTEVISYIPAFIHSSEELHNLEDHMLWLVTYHLNISRNYLKNKPWKQSQELTDLNKYYEQIVLAFIYYMGYLKIMGFNEVTLYNLYWRKNRINYFRQKSGY